MLVARLLGNCVTVSCGGGVCSSDSDRYGSGFGSGTGSFGEMDVKRRRRKLMSVVRSILDNAAYYGMAFMDEQRETTTKLLCTGALLEGIKQVLKRGNYC